MKTRSIRYMEQSDIPRQMTILALIFAFIASPIGLVLCFFARKEGKSTLLTAAWIISIIGTVFWGMMLIWGIAFSIALYV